MEIRYLTIRDWMLELGLSYTELVAYALVWSFSHDGETWFQAPASTISKWMAMSTKRPALKALSSLVAKGLVEKRERWENGVRLCDYKVVGGGAPNAPVVLERHRGGAPEAPGGGAPRDLHNNNSNGYKYPQGNKREKGRVLSIHGDRFKEVWETLLRQPGWSTKSADALDECMRDLNSVCEEDAIEMVRNAIKNGWKGVYPLGRKSTSDGTDIAIAEADRLDREIAERMAARAASKDIKS